jgi:hypothetical protein
MIEPEARMKISKSLSSAIDGSALSGSDRLAAACSARYLADRS